ncbi:unnamed protein product [Timema podura]|uniref:Uncharacterized protein n=1 Tax=Timema podura TaxID=61482 RepID=A0ABN7NW24_TIMPD|nr:unnamed protein product [Timema podura]
MKQMINSSVTLWSLAMRMFMSIQYNIEITDPPRSEAIVVVPQYNKPVQSLSEGKKMFVFPYMVDPSPTNSPLGPPSVSPDSVCTPKGKEPSHMTLLRLHHSGSTSAALLDLEAGPEALECALLVVGPPRFLVSLQVTGRAAGTSYSGAHSGENCSLTVMTVGKKRQWNMDLCDRRAASKSMVMSSEPATFKWTIPAVTSSSQLRASHIVITVVGREYRESSDQHCSCVMPHQRSGHSGLVPLLMALRALHFNINQVFDEMATQLPNIIAGMSRIDPPERSNGYSMVGETRAG